MAKRTKPEEKPPDTDPAMPQESKAQKFRRLANRRVPQVLKRLEHVANLGNRNQYDATEAQINQILRTLSDAFVVCENKLRGQKTKAAGFWLDDDADGDADLPSDSAENRKE